MEEIIKGLLDIERRAQDIAQEAIDIQLNLDDTIKKRTQAIKDAIDNETKQTIKNKLEDEDRKVKEEIKRIRTNAEKKISTMQANYVLNKVQVEEKVFNTIIGR